MTVQRAGIVVISLVLVAKKNRCKVLKIKLESKFPTHKNFS